MAQRATSLGPKPSLFGLFCFVFFLSLFLFPFLFLEEKTRFPPPPIKGHVCLFFSVPLCFSLAFFSPAFHSLVHCLSRVLFFLSSFLVFFVLLSFASLFLYLCLFAMCLCVCFMKENIKLLNSNVFIHQSFLIFLASLSCFVFQIPFSN